MMLDGNDLYKDDFAADATFIAPSIMLLSSPEDAPSDMAARVSP